MNDDMDNLFRRAGEEYPLKVTGDDWNKVASALNAAPVEQPKKKDNRKMFILLAALLITSVVTVWLFRPFSHQRADAATAVDNHSTSSDRTPGARNNTSEQITVTKADVVPQPVRTEAIMDNSGGGNRGQLVITPSVKKNTRERTSAAQPPPSVADVKPGLLQNASTVANTSEMTTVSPEHTDAEIKPAPVFELGTDTVDKTVSIEKQYERAHKMQEKQSFRRVNVSVMLGLDASFVEGQHLSRTGGSFGVIAAYNISPKFAVEAAVISSKKFYYSAGEYFNTSKLQLPPNTDVLGVTGNCRMIEVPVSLKYSFAETATGHLFATAGVATFFMQKEIYDYVYYYRGSGRSVIHSYTYNNSSTHLASTLQLSAGYNFRLYNHFHIRTEPYVQLPLSTVGYGDLRLSSFGLRIAAGKSF